MKEDTWTRKVLHRYAEWTRGRANTTQCSPVLGVIAAIVVFAIIVYTYREVIITTVETAIFAALGTAAFAGVLMLTVSTLRWYRKRAKLMKANPSAGVALATVESPATVDDVTAISREADWLADAGSELVFDKEGNLRAKTGPAS
jgi:hypothetical protein